jgi:hypothetical protein
VCSTDFIGGQKGLHMALRKGDETMIETHTYSQHDFSTRLPIIQQIKQYGFRL